MDIDTVIAEATQVAESAQASPEAKTETTAPEVTAKEPEVNGSVEETKETQIKADSELTPEQLAKREANRQSHLNSKLARLKRENRELREAMERNKPQQVQPTQTQVKADNGAPVKPVESDFQTWGEFLDAKDAYYEALADWKVEQKLSDRDSKKSQDDEATRIEQFRLERTQEATKTINDVAKQTGDYASLVEQHIDFLNNIPPHIDNAFLMAENPGLALYALMKEGSLEELEDMPPHKVLMEIGKAELRGERYLNQNKATNAPPPITPAKGTATTSKSLENKSVEELLKQFNTR